MAGSTSGSDSEVSTVSSMAPEKLNQLLEHLGLANQPEIEEPKQKKPSSGPESDGKITTINVQHHKKLAVNLRAREITRQKFKACKQRNQTVQMYWSKFQKYKSGLGYNDKYLIDHFYDGLNDELKCYLTLTSLRDRPMELMGFVNAVVKLDNRLSLIEIRRNRSIKQRNYSNINFKYGNTWREERFGPVPVKEQYRRWNERCCYYCGKYGHYINDCYKLDR